MPTTPLPPLQSAPTPGSPLALDEAHTWVGRYLEDCQLQLAEETVTTYRKKLNKFLGWWAGTAGQAPFVTGLGFRYARWLDQQQMPLRSQALTLSAVRTWGSYLVKHGRLARNPWTTVQGPGQITTIATPFLTFEQIRTFLLAFDRTTLSGERDHTIAYLMMKTAVRETELARATVGHLHPYGTDSGMLTVRSKGKKRNPEDLVLLVPKVWKTLQRYLARRQQTGPLPDQAPLFSTLVDGEERALSPHDMRRRMRQAFIRAKLPVKEFSTLSLRHTAAMQALLRNAPLEDVRILMRHEAITTTARFAKQLHTLQRSAARHLDHI